MATMWYDSKPELGLAMSELLGAMTGNLQRQDQRMKELAATGALDNLTAARAIADTAEQNAEMALMFEARFLARGASAEAALCRQWAVENRERADRLLVAVQAGDIVALGKEVLTASAVAADVSDAFGVAGAKQINAALGTLGDAVDVADFVKAYVEGDNDEMGKIATQVATGFLITRGVQALITGTGMVGAPAMIVLALAAGIGYIATELVDRLFETIYGKDAEEVQKDMREAIVTYGSSTAVNLGYTLFFGSEEDDDFSGRRDEQNSMTGGLGNDHLWGGNLADYLSGGSGNDFIEGEGGNDHLRGGNGDDRLLGGLGNDLLEGGDGYDTYDFKTDELLKGLVDTIVDSDGLGVIRLDGQVIDFSSMHRALGPATWDTLDGRFRVSVIGGGLNIRLRETGARVFVRGWNNGDLGITLPDLNQPGQPENPFLLDNGENMVGSDGNKYTDPVSGNDIINGLGGNDAIDGGFGDDWVDGDQGDDLVMGGPGRNRLRGGLGNDVLVAAPLVANWGLSSYDYREHSRDDPLNFTYARGWAVWSEDGADRNDAGSLLSGFGIGAAGWNGPHFKKLDPSLYAGQDDELLGGGGHDVAYGGEGDDLIEGGTGNDLLVGGADDDTIYGGDDNDLMLGDEFTYGGSYFSELATLLSARANRAGNDVMEGGEGNDRMYGQGGADVISGGNGNDLIQGDRMDYGLTSAFQVDGPAGNDWLDGGDGDDSIYGDGGNDTLLGGAGNDYLVGDSKVIPGTEHGNDLLDGGDGDDQLYGLGGNDVLYGGAGDDELNGDGADVDVAAEFQGNDRLFGGLGKDVLRGNGGDDHLDGGEDDDQLWGGDGRDTLLGGSGHDQLVGNAGDDVLDGGAGNDKLWGEEGNDVLEGGDGNDLLQGGDGSDSLRGGAGDDELIGEAGNDTLEGGTGMDRLFGGEGNDVLQGDAGDDYLAGDDFKGGAQGNDLLDGGFGNDVLVGGGGNDTIHGGAGNDTIYGDVPEQRLGGDDVLDGGGGNDYLDAGAGDDQLRGGEGADTLFAGEGNDLLVGGQGDDVMDGGAGSNRFEFQAADGHDIVLAKPADGADNTYAFHVDRDHVLFGKGGGFDLLVSIDAGAGSVLIQNFFLSAGEDRFEFADGTSLTRAEVLALFEGAGQGTIIGGDNGETLLGGNGNETLRGGLGNDTISGGGGNDLLIGGMGNDTLDGGTGNDIYEFRPGFGMDQVVNLASIGAGSDTIRFLSGLNRANAGITLLGDDVTIAFMNNGSPDVVVLQGFLASDNGRHVIEFADGTRLYARDLLGTGIGLPGLPVSGATDGDDQLYGTDGNDLIDGAAGNDQLYGGNGDDELHGREGNDRLFGGAGNDTLLGGAGDDLLDGGSGDDRLLGGAGNDVFRYGSGYGNDTIAIDVTGDTRLIQLFNIPGPSALQYTLKDGSLILKVLDTGETLTIEGYTSATGPTARLLFADGTELSQELLWNGNNEIEGSSGDDDLSGYGGDDFIYGYSGNDVLWGGDGKDYLVGGWGADELYGGNGDDVLQGDSRYPYWWIEGGDNDFLDGGAGNDSIYGNGGDDVLMGGAGDDMLSGQDGNDVLNGGIGNDDLGGNAGSDTYVFGRGGGVDSVREFGWLGQLGPQPGDVDTLAFNASVRAQDIVVYRHHQFTQELRFIIEGTNDFITVQDFFESLSSNVRNTIEQVTFADGTRWDLQEMLYQAMRGSYRHDNLTGLYAKNDYIEAGAGNDRVSALDHDDTILGGAGNDDIEGGAGNDILVGGSGSDRLSGDAGNDIYRFGLGSDLDIISNGSTVLTDHDVVELGEGITLDNIRLARSGDALVIDVDGHSDRLIVLGHFLAEENEHWSRGGPIDALRFSDGTIWGAADILARLGAPLDPIGVTFQFDYTDTSDAGGYVIGVQEGMGDVHRETAGATWFDAGPGDARLFGGRQGDTYVFGKGYGRTVITDEGGMDRILFNADVAPDDVALFRLGLDMHVQVLGQKPLVIIGYFAEASTRVIESMAFADGTVWDSAWLATHVTNPDVTLTGTGGNDVLKGGMGNDQLFGLAGDDLIEGGSGDDLLDGGTGADVMRGGMGSDTYIVDDMADVVIDDGYQDVWDSSVNTVRSSVSFTLSENIQWLVLTGVDNIDGSGNSEENVIMGNAGNNVLRGNPDEDTRFIPDWLDGEAGNDTLYGSWGDDTLIGGTGADYMEGGQGADLYFVDHIGDVVVEGGDEAIPSLMSASGISDLLPGPGHDPIAFGVPGPGEHPGRSGDTVASTINYTLGDNVESLILMGSAVSGTGNVLDNNLDGNALDNLLYGLAGADGLRGLEGNDVLDGGEGDDSLEGGLGNDTLIGGDGNDSYHFAVGDGNDIIVNADNLGEDAVYFNDIAFDQIRFSRDGDDLVAKVVDQTDSVTFTDWYADAANRVDWFYDQEWNQLHADDIDARVAASAAGQAQRQGQGELDALVAAMAWRQVGADSLSGRIHAPTIPVETLHVYHLAN